MKLITEYHWVFDEVELGIRIRQKREMSGMSQAALAALLGFGSSSIVAMLEVGTYTQGLPMSKFLLITNWLDLDPCVCFALQTSAR